MESAESRCVGERDSHVNVRVRDFARGNERAREERGGRRQRGKEDREAPRNEGSEDESGATLPASRDGDLFLDPPPVDSCAIEYTKKRVLQRALFLCRPRAPLLSDVPCCAMHARLEAAKFDVTSATSRRWERRTKTGATYNATASRHYFAEK